MQKRTQMRSTFNNIWPFACFKNTELFQQFQLGQSAHFKQISNSGLEVSATRLTITQHFSWCQSCVLEDFNVHDKWEYSGKLSSVFFELSNIMREKLFGIQSFRVEFAVVNVDSCTCAFDYITHDQNLAKSFVNTTKHQASTTTQVK